MTVAQSESNLEAAIITHQGAWLIYEAAGPVGRAAYEAACSELAAAAEALYIAKGIIKNAK